MDVADQIEIWLGDSLSEFKDIFLLDWIITACSCSLIEIERRDERSIWSRDLLDKYASYQKVLFFPY